MTKLAAILDQIDLGSVLLPEFQRGYVWNREVVDFPAPLRLMPSQVSAGEVGESARPSRPASRRPRGPTR